MTSSERRVTVSSTVYPKLTKLANRDGVTVADVVNAILLQTLLPYGGAPQQQQLQQTVLPATPASLPTASEPDPYTVAKIDNW